MTSQTATPQVEVRESNMAVASLALGLSTLLLITWPVCGPLAILFGIIALFKIRKNKPYLKGSGMAVTGILISIVVGISVIPVFNRTVNTAQKMVCGVNMKGLSIALTVYANDYQGRLPAKNWCDLLIEEADVSPKSLVCPASRDIEGECSFAMNKYVVEKDIERLPPDTVVLFETNIGLEDGPRTESIQSRRHFKMLSGYTGYKQGSLKVHPNRFNQYGGPDDVGWRHNEDGKLGCNIVFADGYVKSVTQGEIAALKWNPEEEMPKIEKGL